MEYSIVLNDEYNEWYKHKIQEFLTNTPDIKKHPEKWRNFKFDLNQAKIDTIQITDTEVVMSESPSHLQTTADIHCIGRTTVYDLSKKDY